MNTLQEDPKKGLIGVIVLLSFYLVAILLDWNWAVKSIGRHTFFNLWLQEQSRKTIRIWKGMTTFLAIIAAGILYYYFATH